LYSDPRLKATETEANGTREASRVPLTFSPVELLICEMSATVIWNLRVALWPGATEIEPGVQVTLGWADLQDRDTDRGKNPPLERVAFTYTVAELPWMTVLAVIAGDPCLETFRMLLTSV
jgi:hypothetical protein